MKVKNILFEGNVVEIINYIEKLLIENEIKYVKIKYDNYYEIHFLDYIYRIVFNISIKSNTTIEELIEKIKVEDQVTEVGYYQKERPGFKRNTKKQERQFNKVKVNTKGYCNYRRR